MNVLITPQTLKGVINSPPSKSFAHRMLISAFLSGERVKVLNVGYSSDVITTLTALKALGATVEEVENGVIIERKELPSGKVFLNMNDSGSSLRFFLPVVSALGIHAEFLGTERLLNRPISELVCVLNAHGAKVNNLEVNGKIESGVYEIEGNVSSQYVTGLMLALTVVGGEIIIKGQSVSAPYLEITKSVLEGFGVDITKTSTGYKIKKGYNLKSKEFIVEGDWSGSAFMLVAGAIGGPITIKGLNLNSVQGDREILNVIKKFGAIVIEKNSEVTVSSGELKGCEICVEDIPDLAQIIAVLSAFASGKTVISGVSRLKDKESNRIDAIIEELNSCKVSAKYINDEIVIEPSAPVGAEIYGNKDHRTVMSGAILLSNSKGEGKIVGAEAHVKSYPEFFNDFTKLGGKYVEI